MSFSFNYLAKSKDEARSQLLTQLETIKTQQPVHTIDHDAIVKTVDLYLDLLTVKANTISVSVSGSVGYNYKDGDHNTVGDITGAGVNVSVRGYDQQ